MIAFSFRMIYTPDVLKRYVDQVEQQTSDNTALCKVNTFLLKMIQYRVQVQAAYEASPDEFYSAMIESRNYWDARKATFDFSLPTPCFTQIAFDAEVDLDDDLTCYAVAAAKMFYIELDAFMETIVLHAVVNDGQRVPDVDYSFWTLSMFLHMMEDASLDTWRSETGVPVPAYDSLMHEEFYASCQLWARLGGTLKQAFANYVDAWARWMRHYADKTPDIRRYLSCMVRNLRNNVRLVRRSSDGDAAMVDRFDVGPETDLETVITLDEFLEKAMRVKSPSYLWRRVRSVLVLRRCAFAFVEAGAMRAERERIERARAGDVDDWVG